MFCKNENLYEILLPLYLTLIVFLKCKISFLNFYWGINDKYILFKYLHLVNVNLRQFENYLFLSYARNVCSFFFLFISGTGFIAPDEKQIAVMCFRKNKLSL